MVLLIRFDIIPDDFDVILNTVRNGTDVNWPYDLLKVKINCHTLISKPVEGHGANWTLKFVVISAIQ